MPKHGRIELHHSRTEISALRLRDAGSAALLAEPSTENRKPQTANRLFRIITFGCKVNQVDTAGLSQALAHQGWLAAPPGATPDLHLVNTCTVTNRADQQARQAIRRLSREFPGVPIWVTGCYAQRAPEELAALPGVTLVLGNREKSRPGRIS